VLSRIGARQLNDEELQQVAGGFVVSKYVTGACVFDPIACRVISGDCNKIPPACAS
jgi:bacteriocin-like protein